MKARLLVGLLTVALGGLTSCSNILEENGVINNVAESGMGELRINLSTDATLNVSTKAGPETVEDITKHRGTITVTITNGDTTNKTLIFNPEETSKTETLPIGGYTLSAKNNNNMGESNFVWDCPVLAMTPDQTITLLESDPVKTAELTLTLQNSIIAVNKQQWDDLNNSINIKEFQVVNTTNNISDKTTAISGGTSLLDDTKANLHGGLLYAKSDLANVKVVLDGYVGDDDTQNTFRAVKDIKPTGESTSTKLGSKNKYNIGFELDKENGLLKISVKVDNKVNSETITLPIYPYGSTTQENQSTDGGGE